MLVPFGLARPGSATDDEVRTGRAWKSQPFRAKAPRARELTSASRRVSIAACTRNPGILSPCRFHELVLAYRRSAIGSNWAHGARDEMLIRSVLRVDFQPQNSD